MEALQAELVDLKRATGTCLKKTAPPLGPFPLSVSFTVDAPPAAALYDVPSLGVTATLPCLGAGRSSVDVSVTAGLPPRVTAAASAALKAAWLGEEAGGPSSSSSLGLARLPALVATRFVDLITILPDCVEPYEGVDAAGGTVRRRAIIDTDAPPTVVEAAAVPAPVPASARHPPPATPLGAELAYLARRFKAGFVLEEGKEEAGESGAGAGAPPPSTPTSSFTLRLTPTDPAWRVGPVTLAGRVGPAYPAPGSLSLVATGPRGPAAAALSRRLARRVGGLAGRADGLRTLVKAVENTASELGALSDSSSSSGDEEGAGGVGSGGGDAGGTATPAKPLPPPSSSGAPPATLRLAGLCLDGVDALTPSTLTLQAACGACGRGGLLATFNFTSGGDRGVAAAPACPACGAVARLEAAPRIAHAGGNAIARVRAEGCTPVDLVAPTVLAAQCGRCEGGLAGLRLTVGVPGRRKCPACFAEMAASFEGVAFEAGRAAAAVAAAAAPGPPTTSSAHARARRPSQAPLIPGTPLPSHGACKHYPHSHRWLRFQCCGRAFACDLCHETESPLCPSTWATRQVCGFCSVEARISASTDGKCTACGKRLATSSSAGTNAGAATTRFWEGGAGCRDPSRLDPRDPRRYAGLAKTKSKKSTRVGAAGAAARRKDKDKGKE